MSTHRRQLCIRQFQCRRRGENWRAALHKRQSGCAWSSWRDDGHKPKRSAVAADLVVLIKACVQAFCCKLRPGAGR